MCFELTVRMSMPNHRASRQAWPCRTEFVAHIPRFPSGDPLADGAGLGANEHQPSLHEERACATQPSICWLRMVRALLMSRFRAHSSNALCWLIVSAPR